MSGRALLKGHNYSSGARTKGYFKNTNTGERLTFFYNPNELEISRGATYQEMISPGLSYPIYSYVHGNGSSFPLSLKVIDNPSKGLIKKWENFIDKLLPSTINRGSYKKPDEVTVVIGGFICDCIVENCSLKYERWDESLTPIECTFTLTLRRL